MARAPKPSELELKVLSLLWERGPMTVRSVLDELPDRKERAYTTVLSVLQVMEKKGLVTHTRQGLTHLYKAAVNKNTIVKPIVRQMLRDLFSGRASTAMQYLLGEGDVSPDELAEMRRLIDEASRRPR